MKNIKVIVVSGTPGTGKTTLSKKLSSLLNFTYIDQNKVILEHNLSEGYDKSRDCEIVDTERLNKALAELVNKSSESLVIDGHLSHFLPPKTVDFCVITKCSLKTLKKRLEHKGYSSKKVRENLDVEIFDTSLSEAKDIGHKNIIPVDTSSASPSKLASKIKETTCP